MLIPMRKPKPEPVARSPETEETIRHLREQRAASLAETRRLRKVHEIGIRLRDDPFVPWSEGK